MLQTTQMYVPRACFQCCKITTEYHGHWLLDYMCMYLELTLPSDDYCTEFL